jgi:hypothetical protein
LIKIRRVGSTTVFRRVANSGELGVKKTSGAREFFRRVENPAGHANWFQSPKPGVFRRVANSGEQCPKPRVFRRVKNPAEQGFILDL